MRFLKNNKADYCFISAPENVAWLLNIRGYDNPNSPIANARLILNKKKEFLDNNEIVNKRISNKVWVDQMGHNFVTSHPLVYKEGIFKKARISFLEGNFTETMKRINLAFDVDCLKEYFDPKFDVIYRKKLENFRRSKRFARS